MTSRPTVVGMGTRVGSSENARTLANKAIHTGSGLRSGTVALAGPGSARFAISASVLIEPRISLLADHVRGERGPGVAS